tara:strand:+ start:941 stop:1528 length:588 start_codon:yes stop_codon:yes gene_type:complete
MSLAKEVWDTLNYVNVNDKKKPKGKFDYLSWTWAWSTMMDHYPNTNYVFTDRVFDDGSMEVTCEITITVGEESLARSMWLPVKDFQHNAIINPSSSDINNAKMRCLVKGLAMFGLAIYIYAGEDLPPDEGPSDSAIAATAAIINALNNADNDAAINRWNSVDPDELQIVWESISYENRDALNLLIAKSQLEKGAA